MPSGDRIQFVVSADTRPVISALNDVRVAVSDAESAIGREALRRMYRSSVANLADLLVRRALERSRLDPRRWLLLWHRRALFRLLRDL